jgi:hypothetical protein
MMNHAAAVNRKRSDIRYEIKKKHDDAKNPKKEGSGENYFVLNPRETVPDFENMTSAQIVSYVASGQDF